MNLPPNGFDPAEISDALDTLQTDDVDWRGGRVWSLVYSAGEEHERVVKDAYTKFFNENGLSPAAFRSLEIMERELVGMLLGHLGADPSTAGGTMASGGTESIILAIKAYRDWTRVDNPSMVIPTTSHPAFVKAGQLLGVRVKLTDVDGSFRADPEAVASQIDETTILVGASAPCFPFGVVDPIEELGEITSARGVGLHIDSCLGGIALPFLRSMGRPVPPFDFAVSGVTSMSVDMHKYGFGPKGTSAILYRDRSLRRAQFTVYEDWPGGALASPTLLGTRPGGGIAGAWAAVHHLGAAGYADIFEAIMEATDALQEGIGSIGDLHVLGEPAMSVFAFASASKDTHSIADHLEERGWRIDRQSSPDSLHLIVSPTHIPVVDDFLSDLSAAFDEAGPKTSAKRTSVYGVTSRVPAAGSVRDAILDDLEQRYDGHRPLTHGQMRRGAQ